MDPRPGSRRFIVSGPRVRPKVVGVLMVVWFVVVFGCVTGAQSLLTGRDFGFAGLAIGVVCYVAFLVYALSPKDTPVDVAPNGITIDEGRGGVFTFANAMLGVWNMPMYKVAAGTALHLTNGRRRYRLGGRDHRPSPRARFDAETVESVDAFLPAEDFDALLAIVFPALAGQAYEPAVIRCELMPNRSSGLLRRILPKPALFVDLDATNVRIVEQASGRVVIVAPIASVSARPAKHVYGGRTTYTMPVLVIAVADLAPIRLGIPDFRFSWASWVDSSPAPEYVVGGADWLTLVKRFGVKDSLITTS